MLDELLADEKGLNVTVYCYYYYFFCPRVISSNKGYHVSMSCCQSIKNHPKFWPLTCFARLTWALKSNGLLFSWKDDCPIECIYIQKNAKFQTKEITSNFSRKIIKWLKIKIKREKIRVANWLHMDLTTILLLTFFFLTYWCKQLNIVV